MATTVGTIELIASIDTSQYVRDANNLERTNKNVGDSVENVDKKTGGLGDSLKNVAKVGFGALAAAAAGALALVVKNIDDAVKRVDTLNNADRVFLNMGFAADSTERAVSSLEKSIKGLPTPLDSAIRGVQMLSGTIGDVERSQQVFTALNNAIIGFGGSAYEVEGAIQQLSQLPMDGPLDAQTWNSLRQNGLTPVFTALAKESGVSMGELRDQFSTGELTVADFTDSLIKLNKDGGGGLASLEQIAKDSTSGIGTGFANMETAITRGIAKIIESIGPDGISETMSNTGSVFEEVLGGIAIAFDVVITAIEKVIEWLRPLFEWMSQNEDVMEVLKTGLLLLGGILLGSLLAGIIIVSVAFAVISGIIQELVDRVRDVINRFTTMGQTIAQVAQDAWNAIVQTFSNIGTWFGDRFTEASNAIRNAFSNVGRFFGDIWNNIVNLFSNVGTQVGDAIGNAFRSVINGVIRGAVNIINGFVDAINFVIDVINNIPGVRIGRLGRLPIPQLAEGGIVSSATLALIGEGSEPEAVIPLSKLDAMLDGDKRGSGATYNINIQASANMLRSETDKREFAKMIFEAFNEDRRARSLPQIGITTQ